MSPLIVGIVPESEFLLVLGRCALVAAALPLLLAARRLPRWTGGTFFMALGLAVGFGLFGSTSLALASLVAWVVFGLFMLVLAFAPRVAVALACVWPLPAAYLAWVLGAGGFDVNKIIVGLLAGLGMLWGAVWPGAGLAILGSALGASMVAYFADWPPRWALALGLAALLWQFFVLPLFGPRRRFPGSMLAAPTAAERRASWRSSLAWGCSLLGLALVVIAGLVPSLPPIPENRAKRVEALRQKRVLDRPCLWVSAEDAYYVAAKPYPLALSGPYAPWLNRLALPVMGRIVRSQVGASRAVKDEGELALMRKAADITSQAFADAAPLIKPGVKEADIEKTILASFQRNGATGLAFKCIVGSGRNATLPHYEANEDVMKEGLVVIDIGCSVENYASDMTRTFPVKGTAKPDEAALLRLVAKAQEAGRSALKPGANFAEADDAARKVIKDAGFGKYFTHGVGHPVGLDVHDPWISGPLEPGMVVTIEPGVYIPAGSKADKRYWNLGVRIEDTYVITKAGCEELTHYAKLPGVGEK